MTIMFQLTASKKETIKGFKRKPTRKLPNHSEAMKKKVYSSQNNRHRK